jgi:hypothetical protein
MWYLIPGRTYWFPGLSSGALQGPVRRARERAGGRPQGWVPVHIFPVFCTSISPGWFVSRVPIHLGFCRSHWSDRNVPCCAPSWSSQQTSTISTRDLTSRSTIYVLAKPFARYSFSSDYRLVQDKDTSPLQPHSRHTHHPDSSFPPISGLSLSLSPSNASSPYHEI